MGEKSSVTFRARDYYSPKYWPTWLVLGLLRLIALLPYRAALCAGRLLGRLIYLLSSHRRHIVDINLAHCFPDKTLQERDQIKIDCFHNIGLSMVEMAICWWWQDEQLEPLVEFQGREHLDAAVDGGRGVILLSGHYTSLEISGRLFCLTDPVQAMYRTQSNAMFDSFLYAQRSRYFVNLISRKQTRQLLKGIKNQITTWYAPDQDFRRERNVFAPFMGISTATITATSRLAQSSGAVILPYYPERKKDGTGYVLHFDAPLQNFPSGDDFEDACAVNRSIEKYVRLYPENYIWIHRRFKTRPPGEPPFYS